ncbi:MAG TPA: DUF5320 domain-containing protein [Proteiniclasticum sp.]|nr:DUF5320 domain-containing protein [Proteiniclasticum sp.]
MANRDGTGPMGEGSATGRSLGICTGVNEKRNGTGSGKGLARRCGFGQSSGRGAQLHKETLDRDNGLHRKQKNL